MLLSHLIIIATSGSLTFISFVNKFRFTLCSGAYMAW